MQSVVLVLLGVAGMAFGWFVYSRFIATRIYRLDPDFVTPAHEFNDGRDYVPTHRVVLWGHHFTSVAGAAPIVGPAIAVYWGWAPALAWVVLGTIFFAGVHDFGALWASNRHKGKSIGALSESVIGTRSRALYMIVVFLVLLMVNAVFGVVIANAFVNTPGAVFPAWAAIAVALVIGQLVHRRMNLVALGVIGVAVLYWTMWAGSAMPLTLPTEMFGLTPQANWILILFVYAAIASMLPVWMLLQPRDFINGMQLVVGLALLYGAVILVMPDISAPAFNSRVGESAPSIIPLLFVTVACGAVSGFHGIVASGTSSKQLDKETDARFVGYLGAVGEGSLALITIVAVSGVALAATPEAWHAIYDEFGKAGAGAFISGGARLIEQGWGIPELVSQTILATMVVLFAGTTMDSGVRLQRYIIQEWGEIYRLPWLKNGIAATLVAVACCLLLAFGAGGASGSGGMIIWPLFGSTNQILAGMTLLVISVMLLKLGRPVRYTLLPMIFVIAMSFAAACVTLVQFWRDGKWLLVALDLVVLATSLLVMLEAASAVRRFRRESAHGRAVAS
ncbi:carbon starvation CstA family protein [Sinimarinibacterium flocculans]|uniref:Carbon starvation protein CstA n=1 Tax=Sinimarinibacterium flocculans TaxID=985250 RepID=A0A318E4L7_9GAMM|nr:carbon starvation protein A [Sinimarinibacterium flocculans]PXV65306.1 carbon starvation protein CstA [Sinimarinibacterium flocculans]